MILDGETDLQATFRDVMADVATPVCVVTALFEDGPHGTTVSAFASLSMNPPMVLVSLHRTSGLLAVIRLTMRFGVNILASEQEALSRRFSAVESTHRFDGLGYERGESGVVLLDDALAHVECRRVAQYEAGDHTLFLGEVERAEARDARPLLYYRGGYAQLER